MIVFSTQWFAKYNHILTRVARSIFGEFVFNFHKFGHYVDRKKIVAVRPNSVVEYVGMKEGKVELREHFFGRNEYALRLQSVFYPIWITFHIWDIITRPIPQLNLGFDTLTVYPQAGAGGSNTTVDGNIYHYAETQENFATIISASTPVLRDPTSTQNQIALNAKSGVTDTYTVLQRFFATIVTSALTSSAEISSAVISLYGVSSRNGIGDPILHWCSNNQANNNNLEDSDYTDLGTTSFGNITYSSWSNSGYNDVSLNASGISNISKTGTTKLGARLYWDIAASTTGLTWATGGEYSRFYFLAADNGSNKPKLVVTYTTAVTAGGTPSTLLTLGVG